MLSKKSESRGVVKMLCLEDLVPSDHLLRKIDRAVDFTAIYPMVEQYYCEDNGRPSVDPVVLVKMQLIQHLFGIPSMRRTVREIEVNVAYRWFLGYEIDERLPTFQAVSYAFAQRFPSEVSERIFAWILDEAVSRKMVKPETVFIDGTHIKASANKNKHRKELAQVTAKVYDERLRQEIASDREAHGKKPLKDKDDEPDEREVTVSTTDPDCGMFVKGEHERQFAYTSNTACDENGFVLGFELSAGNVNDSRNFDAVYDKVAERFPELETVVMDAGYRVPWICKKIFEDGRDAVLPYKRPMTKDGFFRKHEYTYDYDNDRYVCPEHHILAYSTTNREGCREYKSAPKICSVCPSRNKCTNSKNHQKTVQRHLWEDYIELADDFRRTPEGKSMYARRKETIERVFADAKEKHGMRYSHYRGLSRVRSWVSLKFAAMNLKKLAVRAWGTLVFLLFRRRYRCFVRC